MTSRDTVGVYTTSYMSTPETALQNVVLFLVTLSSFHDTIHFYNRLKPEKSIVVTYEDGTEGALSALSISTDHRLGACLGRCTGPCQSCGDALIAPERTSSKSWTVYRLQRQTAQALCH